MVAMTPHNRMDWMWDRIHERDDLLADLVGYSPVMNKRSEAAFVEAFDALVERVRALEAERDRPPQKPRNQPKE